MTFDHISWFVIVLSCKESWFTQSMKNATTDLSIFDIAWHHGSQVRCTFPMNQVCSKFMHMFQVFAAHEEKRHDKHTIPTLKHHPSQMVWVKCLRCSSCHLKSRWTEVGTLAFYLKSFAWMLIDVQFSWMVGLRVTDQGLWRTFWCNKSRCNRLKHLNSSVIRIVSCTN